jgi:hypothetical protein
MLLVALLLRSRMLLLLLLLMLRMLLLLPPSIHYGLHVHRTRLAIVCAHLRILDGTQWRRLNHTGHDEMRREFQRGIRCITQTGELSDSEGERGGICVDTQAGHRRECDTCATTARC